MGFQECFWGSDGFCVKDFKGFKGLRASGSGLSGGRAAEVGIPGQWSCGLGGLGVGGAYGCKELRV